jgi:hypothetical protein
MSSTLSTIMYGNLDDLDCLLETALEPHELAAAIQRVLREVLHIKQEMQELQRRTR